MRNDKPNEVDERGSEDVAGQSSPLGDTGTEDERDRASDAAPLEPDSDTGR